MSWEASVLAMGAALGVSIDDTWTWIARPRDPRAGDLANSLRSSNRAARTRALALALAAIARDVEALDLPEAHT